MPGDMTMKGPYARIIRVVLYHEVSLPLDNLHVATLGEGVVGDLAVPRADALSNLVAMVENGDFYLSKHEEVVTMEMHRVSNKEVVVNNEADRSVAAEIVHGPLLSALSAAVLANPGQKEGCKPGHLGRRYCPLRQVTRPDDRNSHGRRPGSCTTRWCLWNLGRM
ncbi:MAG: hypothetical protein Q9211_005996 [Gyalolechia sp. 1 TL-2023]